MRRAAARAAHRRAARRPAEPAYARQPYGVSWNLAEVAVGEPFDPLARVRVVPHCAVRARARCARWEGQSMLGVTLLGVLEGLLESALLAAHV